MNREYFPKKLRENVFEFCLKFIDFLCPFPVPQWGRQGVPEINERKFLRKYHNLYFFFNDIPILKQKFSR